MFDPNAIPVGRGIGGLLCLLGLVIGLDGGIAGHVNALDAQSFETAAAGPDEETAIRIAAAVAIRQGFQSLLAPGSQASGAGSRDSVVPSSAQLDALVSADAEEVLPGRRAFDAGAIRRIEVVRSQKEDGMIRVTARFTLSADTLQGQIDQTKALSSPPANGVWICPIAGRCGPPGTAGLGTWESSK